MSTLLHQPRLGTGRFASDGMAKSAELLVKKPLYLRAWFLRVLFALATVAGLAVAAALWQVNIRQSERRAEQARQLQALAAFLRSAEFAAFARDADAQLLATLNYIVTRPDAARAALPAVTAWEQAHHALPWPLQLMPLPVSAAADPTRIFATGHTTAALLAQRGFVFDDAARTAGRQLLLRLLAPYLRAFVARSPQTAADDLWIDRTLQDFAVAGYGLRSATTAPRAETERLFALYALFGPRMWETIDAKK